MLDQKSADSSNIRVVGKTTFYNPAVRHETISALLMLTDETIVSANWLGQLKAINLTSFKSTIIKAEFQKGISSMIEISEKCLAIADCHHTITLLDPSDGFKLKLKVQYSDYLISQLKRISNSNNSFFRVNRKNISIFNIESQKTIFALNSPGNSVNFGPTAVLSNGGLAVVCGKHINIYIIKQDPVFSVETNCYGTISCLLQLNNGYLISATDKGDISVWNINSQSPEPVKILQLNPELYLDALPRQQRKITELIELPSAFLACGCECGNVEIWDLLTEQCMGRYHQSNTPITAMLAIGEEQLLIGNQAGNITLCPLGNSKESNLGSVNINSVDQPVPLNQLAESDSLSQQQSPSFDCSVESSDITDTSTLDQFSLIELDDSNGLLSCSNSHALSSSPISSPLSTSESVISITAEEDVLEENNNLNNTITRSQNIGSKAISLNQFLEQQFSDITDSLRISIAINIAEALVKIHESHDGSKMHGNLTSCNIYINENQQAELDNKAVGLQANQLAESYQWIAPEVLVSTRPNLCATQASDIYSLGVILWQLITGKEPNKGHSKQQLTNFFSCFPASRERIPDQTPEAYKKIIRRCWSGRQEDRGTAAEALTSLKQLC